MSPKKPKEDPLKRVMKYWCSSHLGCSSRFECTEQALSCPGCGGTNIELLGYLTLLDQTASYPDVRDAVRASFAERPVGTLQEIHLANRRRGGFFSNPAMALVELVTEAHDVAHPVRRNF